MHTIRIEKIIVPFQKEMLLQWKDRDPNIVPKFMLNSKGPGTSNGYGFGEWMAERYFRELGYYVFTNDFDLYSKKTKYQRINKMIETLVSPEKMQVFKAALHEAYHKGFKVENPDLFVFDLQTCFFAEVKKGKDKLREPQNRFLYLAKEILDIDSKLIYLDDKALNVVIEELTVYLDFHG